MSSLILPPQYVALSTHFEGSNVGTSFVDDKGHAFSAMGTSPTTSTSHYKFGSSSGKFVGTGALKVANDSLFYMPNNNTEFTIGMWIYADDATASSSTTTVCRWWFVNPNSPYNSTMQGIGFDTTYGSNWNVEAAGNYYNSGSAGFGIGTATLAKNSWHYLEIDSYNNGSNMVFAYYVDGVLLGSPTVRYANFFGNGNTLYTDQQVVIGALFSFSPQYLSGYYLDDFFILNGLALHKSNFSVPDSTYSSQFWSGFINSQEIFI